MSGLWRRQVSYLFDRRVPRSSFDPRLRAPEPRARHASSQQAIAVRPEASDGGIHDLRSCSSAESAIYVVDSPAARWPDFRCRLPRRSRSEPAAAGGGTGSGACGRSGRSWCSRAAERQSPVPQWVLDLVASARRGARKPVDRVAAS